MVFRVSHAISKDLYDLLMFLRTVEVFHLQARCAVILSHLKESARDSNAKLKKLSEKILANVDRICAQRNKEIRV